MPPAGWDHGSFGINIGTLLHSFAKTNKLGKVLSADTGFRLNDGRVRAPDVAFVGQERVQALQSQGFAKGAPDLAVEIFSPTDSVPQLMRKVKQNFRRGLSYGVDGLSRAQRDSRA